MLFVWFFLDPKPDLASGRRVWVVLRSNTPSHLWGALGVSPIQAWKTSSGCVGLDGWLGIVKTYSRYLKWKETQDIDHSQSVIFELWSGIWIQFCNHNWLMCCLLSIPKWMMSPSDFYMFHAGKKKNTNKIQQASWKLLTKNPATWRLQTRDVC